MDAGRTAIGVCFAIVALAAIWDLVSQTMPNVLTLGGVALGIAIRAAVGYTDAGLQGALRGVAWAFAGIGLCSALPLVSYLRKEMGGGDLKLFAAIGALCGPVLGFNTQASTYAVILVAVIPFRLIRHGAFRATMKNVATDIANMFRPQAKRVTVTAVRLPPHPLGPSIFAGMCVAFTLHGVFR
jgi:prepilin peptidase CpaA